MGKSIVLFARGFDCGIGEGAVGGENVIDAREERGIARG
jgi:hypothetical protein